MSLRESEDHHDEIGGIWLLLAVLLGFTIAISAILDWFLGGPPLNLAPLLEEAVTASSLIYHISVISIAVYIGYLGLREFLLERRLSVEFLMSAASLGALYLGHLLEAATVLLLYSISEYLEGFIEYRARRAVEGLSSYMPEEASVLVDGVERRMSLLKVEPGMTLLVRVGERIPLDGEIVEGSSYIDQSLVTGESTPVLRGRGEEVYAGTLNTSGVLKVMVRRRAEEALVSRIGRLVEESRRRKARVEGVVERFSRFYVPIVLLLALASVTAMPRLTGDPPSTWIYRALTLIVISCPSALLVSVPASIFTAITTAARRGVVIKGGVHLERMARVRAVLFDKTGTLTLGRPSVHEARWVGTQEDKALAYAAALEQYSNHPAAQAIVRWASERGLDYAGLRVINPEEIPGMGIAGYVEDSFVAVGSLELMKHYGCDCGWMEGLYKNDRHTAVCISIGGEALASICLMDEARRDAKRAVEVLRGMGIKTVMLTGDRSEIALDTAERLGVDEFYAGLLPEDKLGIVERMRIRHGMVAMVGDGVNDAPALAASDIGIAMGGSRVDMALESADVVLVKDELIKIPYMIKLSKKTVEIARQNILISIAAKITIGILGMLGLIPLWTAVAAGDDGLTLTLILNTIRVTRVKPSA
ncbi:MAG: cation-translocating P-type ATPase [Candidatus Bathyarchaeia archaeon]